MGFHVTTYTYTTVTNT